MMTMTFLRNQWWIARGWLFCLLAVLLSPTLLRAAVDVHRVPDAVRVVAESGTADSADSALASVTFDVGESGVGVRLAAATSEVKRIELRWNGQLDPSTRCLGDTWERAYADLEWRPLDKAGPMPWYFLATAGDRTDGYGVRTGPGAMCHWVVGNDHVTLVADVRCGGRGVRLSNRTLDVCTVVGRRGTEGEAAFDAAQAFCRQMCPKPRLPKQPVYGYNDWNSTYGRNTATHFLKDAAALVALCPDGPNRPFMVVDDGWQANRQGGKSDGNPWDRTNAKFGSTMPEFAAAIKKLNARPGLWYRPLEAWKTARSDQRLRSPDGVFDPSIPEVRARIVEDMRRFREWGFEFVKFDFTTFEILGRWGNQMKPDVTADGWAFADRSRTTAEIVGDLYRALREGAGDDVTIDACNTVSHLAAGLFEVQRVGDDTSGAEWKRTVDYGVNALAFRAPQQGTFYAVDPDMAGLAKANAIPWEKNRQWVELASHSGTVFFASWKVKLLDDASKAGLREAFRAAATPRPVARPVDWLETRTPKHWRLGDGREVTYTWE